MDVKQVPISLFSVWVEVFGLPLLLTTYETDEKVGATLGLLDHIDKLGIRRGIRTKSRFIEIESMKTLFGNGGSATVATNHNPNSSGTKPQGFSSILKYSNAFALQTMVNPFVVHGPKLSVMGVSALSFSLLGITAAKLAAQLACFRTLSVSLAIPIVVEAA
ncbi:hypothetical protein ACLB2K_041278 [Fragaria x ananassa]